MTAFIKPKRPVNSVFLHCSASDNPAHDNIATIRKWHVEANKWADVGYHYFISPDGNKIMTSSSTDKTIRVWNTTGNLIGIISSSLSTGQKVVKVGRKGFYKR